MENLITNTQINTTDAGSHYLTNQVFRKTYVSIKRSIDDWLRLKNIKKIIIAKPGTATSDHKASKDAISVQELIQYRLQFKQFTKNQIRSMKRPPNFPSKKQRHNTSHYTYSSVNLTGQEEGEDAGVEIL